MKKIKRISNQLIISTDATLGTLLEPVSNLYVSSSLVSKKPKYIDTGISQGYENSQATWELQGGNLYSITSLQGVGKTTLLAQILVNRNQDEGAHGLLFSLQIHKNNFIQLMDILLPYVQANKSSFNDLNKSQVTTNQSTGPYSDNTNLTINDTTGLSTEDLIRQIRIEYARSNGQLDLILIDRIESTNAQKRRGGIGMIEEDGRDLIVLKSSLDELFTIMDVTYYDWDELDDDAYWILMSLDIARKVKEMLGDKTLPDFGVIYDMVGVVIYDPFETAKKLSLLARELNVAIICTASLPQYESMGDLLQGKQSEYSNAYNMKHKDFIEYSDLVVELQRDTLNKNAQHEDVKSYTSLDGFKPQQPSDGKSIFLFPYWNSILKRYLTIEETKDYMKWKKRNLDEDDQEN